MKISDITIGELYAIVETDRSKYPWPNYQSPPILAKAIQWTQVDTGGKKPKKMLVVKLETGQIKTIDTSWVNGLWAEVGEQIKRADLERMEREKQAEEEEKRAGDLESRWKKAFDPEGLFFDPSYEGPEDPTHYRKKGIPSSMMVSLSIPDVETILAWKETQ